MSQSLAVKYRPQVLEEIVGQGTTVKILKRSVQSRNFKNAYLFIGSSGTGKTTCARAFADRINGGVGHPIEVDAASNNGVDNVIRYRHAAYSEGAARDKSRIRRIKARY